MAEHELNKIVDDSGEVFNLRDSTKQPTADRVTAWGSTPSDTKYPSEKLVKDSLDAKANDTSVVHIENEETINGEKKFKGGVKISNSDGDCYGIFMLPTAGSGPNYSTWDSSLQDGEHFREWTLCFPTGANFWGRIRISFLGGYNSFNASGSISKTILCAFNTQNVYNNTGSYDALGINTENEFRISDLIWDDTNARWTIKIHSIKPTSNNRITAIRIEYYCRYDYVSVIRNLTWVSTSPSIVTDTTYYTKRSGNASTSPGTGGVLFNWADKPVFQSPYGYEIFDKSHTIPVGNGGTGKASVTAGNYLVGNGTNALTEKTPNAAANDLINALSTGDSTPTGNDYYVAQYAGGGTTTKTYHRRPVKALWEYIKGQISSVLGLTATAFGGNAATATKATQDSDGNAINATYFKSSGNTTLVSGAATKIGTQNGADVKLTLPTIPSGTQLVYDCGTGSTSTTDFDNALAAYNAGKWVIINKDSVIYHCVGAYNSNLRFKTFANESDLLKVRALTWTRGSAPTVGTTLEAALTSQIPDISGKVNKSGDTMSGNLTISKGANQGDTKFVTSRTDTGTTGWFGVGDGGKNHGVYSESAYANTNNDVDKYTKGWVVRTDENGYSSLTGAVDGLFAKDFGASETLRGMKMFKFGYSLDREGDYTHVSATAIIEARLYSAGVSGGTITMLFNASARGDVGSYYRLQVLSYNNWNLNNVCPVLITQNVSATVKSMFLALVGGGPTSTTLRTFNYTEVKVLPLNGTQKFNWSFGWNTNDFNSNTMTMIKPYVYPRAQIGTAIGDTGTPVYVKADGDFGTATGIDVAVALKDAGRADDPVTNNDIVKVGWGKSAVTAVGPDGTSTYSAGQTVGKTIHLATIYEYDGVAYYKDVRSENVTVGNSQKWNGLNLVMSSTSTPAAATLYIF